MRSTLRGALGRWRNPWPRSPFLHGRAPWTWARRLRAALAGVGALTLGTLGLGFGGALSTGALTRAWHLQDELLPIEVQDHAGAPLGLIDHCNEGGVPNAVPCRESLSVPLRAVSRAFLLAYVAKEDVRFFSHRGVDVGRLPRALLRGAGGSTITQQLLKNSVLAGQFDYDTGRRGPLLVLTRKATELVLAPLVTARYGRDAVLAMSVNNLPWLGIGQRKGVYDAARTMFGVDPADLTLAQSAFLVGLLPAPGRYLVGEDTPPETATARFRWMRTQQLVTLRVLRARGLISEAAYTEAASAPLQPRLWQVEYAGTGPDRRVVAARRNPDYTNEPEPAWALQTLVRRELRAGGVDPRGVGRVVLTIDAATQAALTRRVRGEGVTGARPVGIAEGAAIVDVRGGGIVAVASSTGGALSSDLGRQWAVVGQRPVASTVKPLLYAVAFGQGLTQLSTFPDAPTRYGALAIHNNDGAFLHRDVTVREANARSLNTVAVRTSLEREQDLRRVLGSVGYREDLSNRASPALGTYHAAPLTVAAAYASFANGGAYCAPHLIAEAYNRRGRPIALPRRDCQPLWSEGVAYETFNLLQGAVSERYGHVPFLRPSLRQRLLGQAVPLGAKSGTTDDVHDTWCAAVTPQYAMSVWVGDPNGVTSVPTQMYREQTACREVGLLRELPHARRALPVPADVTVRGGVALPAPGVTLTNPPPPARP
ncbi:transglycosylase domain-containing protein [Deinococcus maricopensis]|uniref:peptidoglycan glycosyltransferase n=1 Tax=Deinococcus maricopensis (strain DSM 21211 / LMG 22137 / NRRL B-23946 / LB-34) TaxID=709986 RepID=E8U6S9_DEIML|nr:transglycosylase domain-containing protein [Deinococcus maricopensis]ADV66768.1 glycosyl transferase family 51 [Deinococcus maricopensis DSM 21211]